MSKTLALIIVTITIVGLALAVLLHLISIPTLVNIVAIFTIPAFLAVVLWLWRSKSTDLERLSKWVTIVAVGLTGLYFLIRVAAGQFSNELQMTIAMERANWRTQNLVSATVTLAHNRERTFYLRDAVAYFRHADGHTTQRPLLLRYYRHSVSNGRRLLDTQGESIRSPRPAINPGDQIQLSAFDVAGCDEVVTVDIVVLAAPSVTFGASQWISTAVSLPLPRQGPGNSKANTT
jgi:hypothetical protein